MDNRYRDYESPESYYLNPANMDSSPRHIEQSPPERAKYVGRNERKPSKSGHRSQSKSREYVGGREMPKTRDELAMRMRKMSKNSEKCNSEVNFLPFSEFSKRPSTE